MYVFKNGYLTRKHSSDKDLLCVQYSAQVSCSASRRGLEPTTCRVVGAGLIHGVIYLEKSS